MKLKLEAHLRTLLHITEGVTNLAFLRQLCRFLDKLVVDRFVDKSARSSGAT